MLPNAQAPPDILKDSLSLRINRSMAQKADSNAPLTNSSLDQSKSKSLNVIKKAPLMKSASYRYQSLNVITFQMLNLLKITK